MYKRQGIWRIGWELNQPQNKDPPNQLPDTPNNKEPIMKYFFDGSLVRKIAVARIKNVNNKAVFGWYLTQGAWKKIGNITKKADQKRKVFEEDKKVSSTIWISSIKIDL